MIWTHQSGKLADLGEEFDDDEHPLLNPKMEKFVTIAGVGLFIVIIILLCWLVFSIASNIMNFGNIVEILDETKPNLDFEKLGQQNRGNILGKYIETLKDAEEGSVERLALYEGVRALLETKRG